MIRFALKCENDHRFESWFQSGSAYDALNDRGLVACPTCASVVVQKDLMAPKVTPKPAQSSEAHEKAETRPMVTAPDPELADAIKKLRDHVEKTSDYVGTEFAKEARAMHEGETPHRPIYGEVKADEAKRLVEDGVPALPLPFTPRQKTN